MTAKDEVIQELDHLDDSALRQVAEYVAFLKFQARRARMPDLDDSRLAALYAEAADEDRELAEAGLEDYADGLADEDVR